MPHAGPNKSSSNRIEGGFKVHKTYAQCDIIFQAIMYNGSECVDLINTRAVPSKPHFLFVGYEFMWQFY